MSEKRNVRYQGIELLRICAAFWVVLSHVESGFLNYYRQAAEGMEHYVPDLTADVVFLLRSFGGPSVVAFFLISGGFVLASASTTDVPGFYKKMWKKLCVPTIIFSILYFLLIPPVYLVFGIYPDIKTGYGYQLQGLFKGVAADHMWYMFVLIGLYLLAPFIRMAKERIGQKRFNIMAVITFIWGTISMLLTKPEYFWGLGTVASFAGVFMMGNVIYERIDGRKDNKAAFGYLVLGIMCSLLIGVLNIHSSLRKDCPEIIGTIFGTNNTYAPLVSLAGMLFYVAFLLFDVKKNVSKPAELMYYVYLTHPIAMMATQVPAFVLWGLPTSVYGKPVTILVILVNSIVVFLLSMFISWIIVKCKKKKIK